MGLGDSDAVINEARGFVPRAPLAIVLSLIRHGSTVAHGEGIALVVIYGAIRSGLGYPALYRALRRVSVVQDAVSQRSVSVIAAGGADAALDEWVSGARLITGAPVLSRLALGPTSRETRLS